MAIRAGASPYMATTNSSTRIHKSHEETQSSYDSAPATLFSDPTQNATPKILGDTLDSDLPAIDETRPCVIVSPNGSGADERRKSVEGSNSSATQRHELHQKPWEKKKCMKSRLKGLADKYVSCLQSIDGGADMRGHTMGGPACVHAGSQPFRTDVDPLD